MADITYVPTLASFLFLAVVMDVFSRRSVGWVMAAHLRTELILDALNMAIYQRRPQDVIHHSDQARSTHPLLSERAARRLAYDPPWVRSATALITLCEKSFFATLECELEVHNEIRSAALPGEHEERAAYVGEGVVWCAPRMPPKIPFSSLNQLDRKYRTTLARAASRRK